MDSSEAYGIAVKVKTVAYRELAEFREVYVLFAFSSRSGNEDRRNEKAILKVHCKAVVHALI